MNSTTLDFGPGPVSHSSRTTAYYGTTASASINSVEAGLSHSLSSTHLSHATPGLQTNSGAPTTVTNSTIVSPGVTVTPTDFAGSGFRVVDANCMAVLIFGFLAAVLVEV